MARLLIGMVLAAVLFAIPGVQTAGADTFNPTFDILQLSPKSPGVPGDLTYQITTLAGEHLPAKYTLTLPPDWGVAPGSSIGLDEIVGNISLRVDQSTCDGRQEFFSANILNQNPKTDVARWRAVLSGALAFDFTVRGDATAGYTISSSLFLDSIYCSPLTLTITHRGSTLSMHPVLVNPSTEGMYTLSAYMVSAPLHVPPDHTATVTDDVAVGNDDDGDGLLNFQDNCPSNFNPNQDDMDADGIGDICDDDLDGDAIPNASDNCPSAANPGQEDMDGDLIGDACDDDMDGDGISNAYDNCPSAANPGQEDMDGDLIGDACDTDMDGDGWSNAAEQYIGTNPQEDCVPNGWPPDIEPQPDGNRVVQIDDVSFVAALFGLANGQAGFSPRAELASQNGVIQIDDVSEVAARFGSVCQ